MIKALFAADQFGGIGLQGTLPWPHNRSDMQHFHRLTHGHVVVMGRRTWDDPKMPKPLKDRTVYVATNRLIADSVHTISGNIADEVLKLEQQYPEKTIWVIGGAEIIEQCEGIYDRIHLTHVKGAYRTDTQVNLKGLLSGCPVRCASAAPEDNCTFVEYEPVFKRTKTSV
jgi:dihydrofolate reductase